eukprot:CAMPEP_0173070272 /NCGR_PEP_ID=MMETSP1102-20130122/8518_1 /TAXON_ID=49646 /ORGANISM="Geminigera sp., Strain Caron Lab Isolate" /LENGTH=188 /DNA_ID=CAMNT_0013938509 /DNA_START=88 /DNA_END=654 /DNA_ORIENTATION=-
MYDKCSARAIFDSWNLTDKYAADVVYLRKPSCRGTRPTKKLESSLLDKCSMRDVGLLISTLAPEDCPDVVRPRKPSRKSSRYSLKLESSLHDKHKFERFSDKALHTHAMANFNQTHTPVTAPCIKTATDGNRHGNLDRDEGWLSDNVSDVSTRPSSSTEALLYACSPVLIKDLDDQTQECSECFAAGC